jgi:hypothetical protein
MYLPLYIFYIISIIITWIKSRDYNTTTRIRLILACIKKINLIMTKWNNQKKFSSFNYVISN